jgi:hypothetical protein
MPKNIPLNQTAVNVSSGSMNTEDGKYICFAFRMADGTVNDIWIPVDKGIEIISFLQICEFRYHESLNSFEPQIQGDTNA